MQALCQDREASELVGINVPVVASMVWILGGAAAGLAGFVLAPLTTITPDIGIIIVHGFAGAILGGFERVGGAMIGGLTLGIVQVLIASYVSTAFASVLSLLVVITVLVIRPSGLLGRA
jgi:branched-chain amino acid transport system permease protein